MTYDAFNRLKTVAPNGTNGRTIEYQYNASGNVVQTYSYDSFGNITQTGSISQPYAFTGREYDSETGMYFYRARYYDPKVGRFVTKDPLGFGGGINVYNYVGANPINWGDPLGLLSSGDIKDFFFSPHTKEDYDRFHDQLDRSIREDSGLEKALNAPPYHPLQWEKDAIRVFLFPVIKYVFGDENAKFSEPFGHPLLGHPPKPCDSTSPNPNPQPCKD